MTVDKFQEFQKYITDTDFTEEDDYYYKLYISYYSFTDIPREFTKIYEGNNFKTVIQDYIPDKYIEDIDRLLITFDDDPYFGDELDLIEFKDDLEVMKKRYAENGL